MQLRRLAVENVRSYDHAELELGPGTTLISGDVGSGKSSLLYAIEMALFGFAAVDPAYLVRHRAAHAEVEVTFSSEEHTYTVRRRFRRIQRKGRESFELERSTFTTDGSTTPYSATELKQRVIDLLGFPDNPNPNAQSDLWRWAVYIPQERMREILGQKPIDRLETVRKALGVERFRVASENAAVVASAFRRDAETRHAEAERMAHWSDTLQNGLTEIEQETRALEGLALRRARLEGDLRSLEETIDELDRTLRTREGSIATLDSLRAELVEETKRREARRAEMRDGLERIERLQRTPATSTDPAGVEREAQGLAGLRKSIEEQRLVVRLADERQRQLIASDAELRSVKKALEETALAIAAAERDRDARRARVEELGSSGPRREPPEPTPRTLPAIDLELGRRRGVEETAARRLDRAERALDELDQLLRAGECPRCHQTVQTTEFEPHRRLAESEAGDARATYQSAIAERAEMERERAARERFERAHDRWMEMERRRSDARTELDHAEEAVGLAARAHLAHDAQRLRVELDRTVWSATMEADRAARERLEALEGERDRRDTALEAARREVDNARSVREELDRLRREQERNDREVCELDLQRSERLRRIEQLVAELRTTEDVPARRREAADRLIGARQDLARRSEELVRAEERIAAARARVEEARVGEAARRALMEEERKWTALATWFSGPFRDAVLRLEQRILARAQQEFDRDFRRFFTTLIDDPSLVARTDIAFSPTVAIDGEWTPPEALSGGERTALALAFRLALGQVVRTLGHVRLDTLLLDEPTDGFSPEQVIRMGELLDELHLPQVVLVSHESQLSAVADRVVLVEKIDGRSVLGGRAALGASKPPKRPRAIRRTLDVPS